MKSLLCLATLTFLSIAGNATTIFIDSNALSTTNNSGHATVDLSGSLPPNPGWAAALPGSEWVSYGPTGNQSDPGYFSPANGTVVTFTTQFILSGLITTGSLKVMADDSTSVILNGHTLMTANTTTGSTCSNIAIGCLASTAGVFNFTDLDPYLVDGVNTLSFGVRQVASSSFGLDFAGSVGTTATPEPATVAYIGGGLTVLLWLRRRR